MTINSTQNQLNTLVSQSSNNISIVPNNSNNPDYLKNFLNPYL